MSQISAIFQLNTLRLHRENQFLTFPDFCGFVDLEIQTGLVRKTFKIHLPECFPLAFSVPALA